MLIPAEKIQPRAIQSLFDLFSLCGVLSNVADALGDFHAEQ